MCGCVGVRCVVVMCVRCVVVTCGCVGGGCECVRYVGVCVCVHVCP